jgi:hypothetical protein
VTTDSDLFKQRLKGMKELLQVLRPERFAYLGVCIFFSLVLAAVIATALFSGKTTDYKTLMPMFGSSGGVVMMTGLALVVFNRAINIVFVQKEHAPARSDRKPGKKGSERKTSSKGQPSEEEKGAGA